MNSQAGITLHKGTGPAFADAFIGSATLGGTVTLRAGLGGTGTIALNDGKVAQPWVYFGGDLSSTDGAPADGLSFASSALDFDPDKVLGKLQTELPQSRPDLFFIEGGQGGIVRYSVAVTSSQGGQLIVVVGPDGTVKSVDAS